MIRRPDERGSAAVWSVHLLVLLAVGALAASAMTGLVAGHRRAQAAADLAALAGASAAQAGRPACAAAAEIASRNDAQLASCTDADGTVTLRVATTTTLLGRSHTLLGLARAGPADVGS